MSVPFSLRWRSHLIFYLSFSSLWSRGLLKPIPARMKILQTFIFSLKKKNGNRITSSSQFSRSQPDTRNTSIGRLYLYYCINTLPGQLRRYSSENGLLHHNSHGLNLSNNPERYWFNCPFILETVACVCAIQLHWVVPTCIYYFDDPILISGLG